MSISLVKLVSWLILEEVWAPFGWPGQSRLVSIHPSIHPFSTLYPGSGHGGSSVRKPIHPFSLATSSSSSWGSQCIPRPIERYNPCSVSWVCPRGSCRLDMPETPPLEGVRPSPFDWTLRYWVCVCCFVLLYFGCYVMCEKKKCW